MSLVCMYVCVFINAICVFAYICVFMFFLYASMPILVSGNVYGCVRVFVWICVCVCGFVDVFMYVGVRVREFLICLCECICFLYERCC